MESEALLAFQEYVGMLMIQTILAIYCTGVVIISCIKQHKFLITAKVLISYWISWIFLSLYYIFSENSTEGFGVASPITLYLHTHSIINVAFNVIYVIVLLYVVFLPFIMWIYLETKKSKK